ncbi:TEL2-interacting protein 1 [Lobosporangium transversale]|nr:TEL2-interacting protein 1 [Lobosporangium transversale]
MEHDVSAETIATFSALRGPASSLMTLSSIDASNAQEATQNLNIIHTVLTSMAVPELHLTKQLIAYTQHALNHVLRLCQKFMQLDKRFDFLVEAWCRCLEFLLKLPDGYAFVMGANWQYSQLLFDVLFRAVDGLPVRHVKEKEQGQEQGQHQFSSVRRHDPTALPKDRMADEVRLTALRCLVLALPLNKDVPTVSSESSTTLEVADTLFEVGDRQYRTDKDKVVRDHLLEPANNSTLGQMLVILLTVSKDADLVQLRRMALEGIMKLLKCLETPERIATWFPGLAAGLTETMLRRGHKENHSVLVKSLDIWTYLLSILLKDQENSSKSQLVEAVAGGSGLGQTLMSMYKDKAKLKVEITDQNHQSSVKSQSPMIYRSEEWMKKTNKGLRTLFKQLAPLRAHSHWMVRFKFGEMAFTVMRNCQQTLAACEGLGIGSNVSGITSFLLETLISCTQDEYRDVYEPARVYLGELNEEHANPELTSTAKEILREKLMVLPRILHAIDESKKQNAIRLAQGLALFIGNQTESLINYQTLPSFVQPWLNALTIEQLDQHNMDERRGILGSVESANLKPNTGDNDQEQARWNAWVQSHKGSGRKFGFPRRIHVHLREQSTANAFMGLLRQLGSTVEIDMWTEELISRLQQDCRSVRESLGWFDTGTVSSVLMMNHLLLGAHGIGLATFGKLNIHNHLTKPKKSSLQRKHQRHVRRAARGVLEEYLAAMVECSQMSLDARERQEASDRVMSSTDKSVRARKLALAKLFSMENEDYDIDAPEAQIYDYNMDIMLKCLLLEGIASIAVVLGGTEFEMELVRVLYILLEHLGDQDSTLVRDTAEATLEHVAFVCHYDSIGDLIQANYDYVIQQVSQRIAFLSSNPKTPQVLWALIRVVGSPAVSMLEDSVTEIFGALDHWKNQEDQVGEGLLKSLGEIVKVMAQDMSFQNTTSEGGTAGSKRDSGVLMSPGIEFSERDKPSAEVAEFAKKYRIMVHGTNDTNEDAEKLRKETEDMTPEEIKKYFMKLAKDAKEDEEKKFGERVNEGDVLADDDQDDENTMSFGDLRAKLPKPSKEAQPDPITKHQALCLRILDKAGYFLTTSSPRMRILALEIIQSSIIVLKDRPQELHPAIHAFWPSIVGRVLKRSEMEVFYVSLRAIEVVTLLAENCSDFLGRHLLDDIWPFIIKALQAWTTKKQAPGMNNKARVRITSKQQQDHKQKQRLQGRREASAKVYTLEHRLQMTTLESVAKIVCKVRIPVRDLWDMLLLARDMMLDHHWTLHWDVRMAASEAIKSMAVAGHGDAVFINKHT